MTDDDVWGRLKIIFHRLLVICQFDIWTYVFIVLYKYK